MISFEPLEAETRIILPEAVGPIVQGRIRRFLLETAQAFAASNGEGFWPGIGAKPQRVTIYDVIGLSSAALEELADLILADGAAIALQVRLPNGTAGYVTRAAIEADPV
jgi:hypothetical protein